jgi:transketolase
MEVFAPADDIETEKIVKTLSRSRRPAYLRLVRSESPTITDKKLAFTMGKSNILKVGKDITIVSYGPIINQAFTAVAKLAVGLGKKAPSLEIINCSSIKPLDIDTIIKSVKKTKKLICLEDHQKNGGLGQKIASLLVESGIQFKFIHLGVDDQFGRSGKDLDELYDYYHIGINDLMKSINTINKK